MRRLLIPLLAATLVALFAYLLVAPVPIEPRVWAPPPAPSLESGTWMRNEKLRGVQRIADSAVEGPEAIAFDSAGRLYTGLSDGRVVSMRDDGGDCRVLGNTGGRALGLRVQDDGALLIADGIKGLLRMTPDGQTDVLSIAAEGVPLGFADDLDVDPAGRVFFSDASWKFGYGKHLLDALEHGQRGRLLLHDLARGDTGTLLTGLSFANGVALGPDADYVLVNQTTEYRITRYWLKGERAGQSESFIENLPGFPDNLTFNGSDRFWVALYAPRDALLDWLLPQEFLRKVVARLPAFLQPAPKRQGFILGLDLEGRVAEQYQYDGRGAYGPITSVREHNGLLYLGSLSETAIGRISLRDLRSGRELQAPEPLRTECANSSG